MKTLPTKDQIRQWILDNPALTGKRDIAKAFGISGDGRIDLKRMLKELEAEGTVEKKSRRFRDPGGLPPVSVLEVTGPDGDMCLAAEPDLLKLIVATPEAYYVNVHTGDFPKGAIRGQLATKP